MVRAFDNPSDRSAADVHEDEITVPTLFVIDANRFAVQTYPVVKHDPRSLPCVPELTDLATLQAQMQRPAQNVNMDGSFELGWGTALLCFGFGTYFSAVLPKWMWASSWTAWIGYVPLICAAFAPYGIPKLVKRFVTWPRTGYVANPHEIKLIQLVTLMIFGGALGVSLTLPFILVSEIQAAISQTGPQGAWKGIILHGIKLLVCATLTVYLGRKVIKKRPILPAAYDAALIRQNLSLTPAGRTRLRLVQGTLSVMFIGIPVLVIGVVLALMYLDKAVVRHAEVSWSQLGLISFMVGTNALLYLMGNGMAMRQHQWKWLVLALLLVAPIVVAPAIPFPITERELIPVFDQLPPVMLSLGLVWFLSGAVTLICFTGRNPLPLTETP